MVVPVERPQTRNEMSETNERTTTVVGIITVAILGSIILFIIVYCKFYRKFKRMKTELAHVHYIADPHIQPGKQQVSGLTSQVSHVRPTLHMYSLLEKGPFLFYLGSVSPK